MLNRTIKNSLLATVLLLPCAAALAHDPVALADVPAAVMDAIKARIPGITVTNVLAETESGTRIYTLEGRAGDKEYAIEALSGGIILGVYDLDYYEENILD